MLDMYACRGEVISSVGQCYDFLDTLPELLRMAKQSPPFVFRSDQVNYPDKAGCSGWVPLIESGIQLHTIEPVRFASLDVYSCNEFDRGVIIGFAQKVFQPAEMDQEYILRGKRYVECSLCNAKPVTRKGNICESAPETT